MKWDIRIFLQFMPCSASGVPYNPVNKASRKNANPTFLKTPFSGIVVVMNRCLAIIIGFLAAPLVSAPGATNMLVNPGFETAGSAVQQAANWEYGTPDTHGGNWGSAVRTNWQTHGGSWEGALRGGWSGETSGGWWQEKAGTADQLYQASAWFLKDPEWTTAVHQLRIKFFPSFYGTPLSTAITNIVGVTTGWTQFLLTARAPANTAWVRCEVEVSGFSVAGSLHADDFELMDAGGARSQNFNNWGKDYVYDGCHEKDWTVCDGRIVTGLQVGASSTGGVIISEYVEGNGNNKGVEIYNGMSVAASNLLVQNYANGGLSPSTTVIFSNAVGPGETYVIMNNTATSNFTARADQLSSAMSFNGDDALVLRSGGASGPILDSFGQVGFDPGNYWGILPDTTVDHTLTRRDSVVEGDSVADDVFDPSEEWEFYPVDTYLYLGSHSMDVGGGGQPVNSPYASIGMGIDNYIQSGYLSEGLGSISFIYRVQNSTPLDFDVQTSVDGISWGTAASVVGITNRSFENFFVYDYEPDSHYVRIVHTGGANRLHVDDINVALPVFTGNSRVQDFSEWHDAESTGSWWSAGWLMTSGRVVTAQARANNCGWLQTNSYLRSPWFDNGAGYFNFYYRHEDGNTNFPISFALEASTDSNTWTTVGTWSNVTSAAYQYASQYFYAEGFVSLRIRHTGGSKQLILDDINILEPALYRTQNFDEWPSSPRYLTTQEFQGWTIGTRVYISGVNPYIDQNCRLDTTAPANNGSYIMSPRLVGGIGTISFVYRPWTVTKPLTYNVQVSTNGINWVTLTNVVLNTTNYVRFSLYRYDTTNEYFRVVQTAGQERALFDDFSVATPTPPATVFITGTHLPLSPSTNDAIRLQATVIPYYGAQSVTVTGYYRIGTSGAFSAVSMPENGYYNYLGTNTIGPLAAGTVIQYFMKATYSGFGAEFTSPKYYPSGGSNNPASCRIVRNPAGQIWINEIDYQSGAIDLYDGQFVELAGPRGFDLSGWTIELLLLSNLTEKVWDTYTIGNGQAISNGITGNTAFWVLGTECNSNYDPIIIPAVIPRDMTFKTNAEANWLWNPIFFAPGVQEGAYPFGYPAAIRVRNEGGGTECAVSYYGTFPGISQIGPNDDITLYTNGVALTGSGTNGTAMIWIATNTSPDNINIGESFEGITVAATVPVVIETNSRNPGVFTVYRQGSVGNLTVQYLLSGTATNSIHYTNLTGNVVISNGLTSANVRIFPIPNGQQMDRDVILTLKNPNDASYFATPPSNATVTILDFLINRPPNVDAGPDRTVGITTAASLDGTVTDDGKPSAALTNQWTQQNPEGLVIFANSNSVDTTATFTESRTYVLRLTSADGGTQAWDEVTYTVIDRSPSLQSAEASNDGVHISMNYSEAMNPATTTNTANYSVSGGIVVRSVSMTTNNMTAVLLTDALWPQVVHTVSVQSAKSQYLIDVSPASLPVTMDNLVRDGSFTWATNFLGQTNWSSAIHRTYAWAGHTQGWARSAGGVATNLSNSTYLNLVQVITNVAANDMELDFKYRKQASVGQAGLECWVKAYTNPVAFSLSDNPANATFETAGGPGELIARATNIPSSTTWTSMSLSVPTVTMYPYLAVIFRGGGLGASGYAELDEVVLTSLNEPPTVDAGEDQTVGLSQAQNVQLNGVIADDGLPTNGTLVSSWSLLSAPPGSDTEFVDTNAPSTIVTFSTGGVYVLRLTANDGGTFQYDDVQITVDGTSPYIAFMDVASAGTNITLVFNEAIDRTRAQTKSNYALNFSGSILSAVLDTDDQTVYLATAPLSNKTYTLTLNNLMDLYENVIAPNTQTNFSFYKQSDFAYYPSDDTYVRSGGSANYNYGRDVMMASKDGLRALVRFDVSTIPANVTILSAQARFTASKLPDAYPDFNLFKVAETNGGWIEGTNLNKTAAANEPCWNYKGYSTKPWAGGTNGCSVTNVDYETNAVGQGSWSGTNLICDLSPALVQFWRQNSASNFGLLVVPTNANTSSWIWLATKEDPRPEMRPVLVVSYTTSAVNWTITSSAGPHGAIAPTGNIVVVHGGSTNFVISPAIYYHVTNLVVNNASVGSPTNYTWLNVNGNGTIQAQFGEDITTNFGTPTWWLALYGWTSNFETAAASDTDVDGLKAWQERIAGTNPTNGNSFLGITNFVQETTAKGKVLRWSSVTGRLYAVRSSTNLLNANAFDLLQGGLTWPQASYTDTLHNLERMIFYRIDVSLP